MTRREYDRLLKRAALAYNLGSDDYESIMDEATQAIEVSDDDSDDAWEKFCADLDEAIKIHKPTQRQIAAHQRKQKQKAIDDAKHALASAQRRLKELQGS